jgi:NAD(P)-dependent dehydrogenase (short-subunit alcohol dehydrogenase family)
MSPPVPLEPGSILLNDRVAVVTGAAVGIGAATATALARFGADVAMCDRDEANLTNVADEVRGLGRRALTSMLDVRDADAVSGFASAAASDFGHVDILVNNAGGGFPALFADVNAKGQDALIRENFGSVTHFIRSVLPAMGPGGSIINITSIEAHRAAPMFAVYSAMKAAVASLTKSLALELGPRLIRVNCIAPDVIPTPGIGDPPVRTPLPRKGDPDDVAAAVIFLAGGLSEFVTGTTIHVDGGNLAAGGWRAQAGEGWST